MQPIFQNTLGWDELTENEKAAEELAHTRIIILEQKEGRVIKVIPETDNLRLQQLKILPEFQRKGIGTE